METGTMGYWDTPPMDARRAGTNELAEWPGSVWEPIVDLRDAVCVHQVVDELSAVSVAWPGEGENGMVVELHGVQSAQTGGGRAADASAVCGNSGIASPWACLRGPGTGHAGSRGSC